MRNLIATIILLFVSVASYGQNSINNFTLKEGEIIWQKIYDTELSFKELYTLVKVSGICNNIDSTNNKIVGDLKAFTMDHKGAGYSAGMTPLMLINNSYFGFMVLEYQNGRYRLTCKKIYFMETSFTLAFTGSQTPTRIDLNTQVIKKDAIRESFKGSWSKIIDHTLNTLFVFRTATEETW